jgi:hypothetical protein
MHVSRYQTAEWCICNTAPRSTVWEANTPVDPGPSRDGTAEGTLYTIRTRRRRSELRTTEIELVAIATDAKMGLNRIPHTG